MSRLSVLVQGENLRPWIVYICLVLFLRLPGKRELVNLNPFDLNLLLSFLNSASIAINADGNTLPGGLIDGFSLLAAKSLPSSVLYRPPCRAADLPGPAAVRTEGPSEKERIGVPSRNRLSAACALNGSFYVRGGSLSLDESRRTELHEALRQWTAELCALCGDRAL